MTVIHKQISCILPGDLLCLKITSENDFYFKFLIVMSPIKSQENTTCTLQWLFSG